jgi:hypothetical protein
VVITPAEHELHKVFAQVVQVLGAVTKPPSQAVQAVAAARSVFMQLAWGVIPVEPPQPVTVAPTSQLVPRVHFVQTATAVHAVQPVITEQAAQITGPVPAAGK